MRTLSNSVRKITTFFLALLLWLHALFFFNPQSALIARTAQLLGVSRSEVLLFALLIVFSFLAGSGFWKSLLSVIYIYFFPFVVLWYVLYWCFLILRAINTWLTKHAHPGLIVAPTNVQNELSIGPIASPNTDNKATSKPAPKEIVQFLLRPFRRFTLLWSVLLLITTHRIVLWMCLIVVGFHLVRDIFLILEIILFSDPWMEKVGNAFLGTIEKALAGIAVVTPDTTPTAEQKNFLNQIKIWTKIANFLKDPYLVSRWAWVLGVMFFGLVYVYVAVLFSFAYYGLARVNGVAYPWLDAVVASLFIPFFISELPKLLILKFVAGLHCVLVLAVGIGTLINFIQRRLRSIHLAATNISDRLSDQVIRENVIILEAKLAPTPPTNSPPDAGKI
jgi:hypothetical protein